MRTSVVIVLALMMFMPAAWAQQPDIPAPPNSTLVTEINLSESDILGMIKAAIPAFAEAVTSTPGELSYLISQLNLNALVDSIRDVKQIRVVQYRLLPGIDSKGILDFYDQSLPDLEGWSRLLYDISALPKGAAAIYTRSGQDFLIVGVDPSKNAVFAARTVGFVDVPKLAEWVGKALSYFVFLDVQKKQETESQPAAPVEEIAPVEKSQTNSTAPAVTSNTSPTKSSTNTTSKTTTQSSKKTTPSK